MNEKFEQAITTLLNRLANDSAIMTPHEIQAVADAVYALKACSNVASDYRIM
jgi:hypothetical protein